MTWSDKSNIIYADAQTLYTETVKIFHELRQENTKASKKIDETWNEIKNIQGRFTREEYLKIFTKFSNENLTTTVLIDEILNNLFFKINEMKLNVKKLVDEVGFIPKIRKLEDDVERLNSLIDSEYKKNDLNRSRFQGISDYLSTVQNSLSDQRMEEITKNQHEISKDTHKLAKTQVLIAISIGILATGSLGATIWFGTVTSDVLEKTNSAIESLVNATEVLVETSKESRDLELASIESQYSGFRADLTYWFNSINKYPKSDSYSISIRNNGETETYLKHRLYVTAYCDIFPGDIFSIDEKLIDDEEMTIKFEKRNSLKFNLPDEVLGPKVQSFELRLTVVAHPNLSSGYLEGASDNKKIHIQYVLSEDLEKWQPTVTSFDGGFQCGREPYGSDVNRADYAAEDVFLECSACK